MFQYNHACYTSRGGSKPFLAGFQPPKTILTIRPALRPRESVSSSRVLSCQLNVKVILSPRHLNAVHTHCDRVFLCSLRAHLKRQNRPQVNTNDLSEVVLKLFSTRPHYGPSASLMVARMSFTYYVINTNQPDL